MNTVSRNERSLQHDTFEESVEAWRASTIEHTKKHAPLFLSLAGGIALLGASIGIYSHETATDPSSAHLPAYQPTKQRYVGDMPISCQSHKFALPNDLPSYVAEYQVAEQCYPDKDPADVMHRMHDVSHDIEQPGDVIEIANQ